MHHLDIIAEAFKRSLSGSSPGYKTRHIKAYTNPEGREVPIVKLLVGIGSYMATHYTFNGVLLENDGFLGPAWLAMVKEYRKLLNGDCGRLDCGALDAALNDLVVSAGFDPL